MIKIKMGFNKSSTSILFLKVATFIVVVTLSSSHHHTNAKYISEFTLDELTNADATYQPVNFATHNNLASRYNSNPLASASNGGGSIDGMPNQQRQSSAATRQNSANRVQLIEQQALANNRQAALQSSKRGAGERKTCHPTKPFLCPSDDPQGGECIPIQYLCDGSSDCPAYSNSPGGYDEDPLLCTAAKRPPVEETANFLRTLIEHHGALYIEKLFGPKISQALVPLGGPERVAIALSVSKTIEDFGKALHLMRGDIDHLRNVLVAVQTMDGPMLKNLGIVRNSELADMKFFLEKLLSTGFLD